MPCDNVFEIICPDFLETKIIYDSKTHKTFIQGYPDNAEHATVILAVLVKTLVDNGVLEPDDALATAGYAAGIVKETP